MLRRVIISLTDSCNLKCLHCYNALNRERTQQSDFLCDEFARTLSKMGVIHIGFTGGEPLLEWSRLLRYIKMFKRYSFFLLVTTNGTLLTDDKLNMLKSVGLDAIQVSIDGCNQEKHEFIRGKNTYKSVIKFFKESKYRNYSIIPMYTITKHNYMDVDKFLHQMISYGVTSVGFERYIPSSGLNGDRLLLDKQMLEYSYEMIYKNEHEIDIHINDPLYNAFKIYKNKDLEEIIIKYISDWRMGCSALRTSIYIDSCGNILPCTFSNRPIFNVNTINILNIEDYLINTDVIENGKCKTCKYAKLCRGCRASALYSNDKLWEGDDPLCFMN